MKRKQEENVASHDPPGLRFWNIQAFKSTSRVLHLLRYRRTQRNMHIQAELGTTFYEEHWHWRTGPDRPGSALSGQNRTDPGPLCLRRTGHRLQATAAVRTFRTSEPSTTSCQMQNLQVLQRTAENTFHMTCFISNIDPSVLHLQKSLDVLPKNYWLNSHIFSFDKNRWIVLKM